MTTTIIIIFKTIGRYYYYIIIVSVVVVMLLSCSDSITRHGDRRGILLKAVNQIVGRAMRNTSNGV